MSDISDLQHAINRYFGNLIGSPIAEDGVIGAQTTAAMSAIISGLPGVDPKYGQVASSIAAQFPGGYLPAVTAALNDVADQQNWLYDSSVVSHPAVASGATPQRIAPTKITTAGGMQASLNSIASQVGLPTWAVLAGAVVGGAVVYMSVSKRKRKGRRRS